MEINIRDLREMLSRIFDHIENDLGVTEVTLDRDHYWEVPEDDLYRIEEVSPKLDIGQLSDDWHFLQPLIDDEDQALALTLIHIAPILRYLALKIGQ
jgi:hypothetical protein